MFFGLADIILFCETDLDSRDNIWTTIRTLQSNMRTQLSRGNTINIVWLLLSCILYKEYRVICFILGEVFDRSPKRFDLSIRVCCRCQQNATYYYVSIFDRQTENRSAGSGASFQVFFRVC